MHCIHCGAEVKAFDKFCRKCGAKSAAATPAPSVSAEPQTPPQLQAIPAARETPPSRSNAAMMGVAALLLVLIVGAGGYWYMSQRQTAIVGEGPATTTGELATTTSKADGLENVATSQAKTATTVPPTEDAAAAAVDGEEETIIVREQQGQRDGSALLTVDRVDYNQKGMNFWVTPEDASLQDFIQANIGRPIVVTYQMEPLPFWIVKARLVEVGTDTP